MRWRPLIALLALACGPQKLEVKMLDQRPGIRPGPKASPEEIREEVPPLRGLWAPAPLVPPKFVPPEPPVDPEVE